MTEVVMKNEYPQRFRCVEYSVSSGQPCRNSAVMRCPVCGRACCGIHAKYANGRQICRWCAEQP